MAYREWERNCSEEWKIFLDQHPNCRALAERYQKYYWKIWNLRIIDDDFMRKILADKSCLQLVLRIIMEKPDLEIVEVNIQDDTELGKLMHDSICPNPDQMHYSILARQARYYKETEKGVTSMCRIFEEVKEEGREEGREESRKIVCQELLNLLCEYGEIPTQWKEKIEGEDDLLQLSLWFRRAAQVQTLEEFELS